MSMFVSELFEKLSYGELSNLNLSGEGNGGIIEEKQPATILHANNALLTLYSRFILKEKDFLLEEVDHITNYHLLKKYAESQQPQPGVDYAYIKDLNREHFEEDIIKIMMVYDGGGHPIPLNDFDAPGSVFTPLQQQILQVPNPRNGVSLGVGYQAMHEKLVLVKDVDQLIEMPEVLHCAYTSLIGSYVYGDINTQEATIKSQMLFQRYDSICLDLIERDILNSSTSTTNTRFKKRGWV